MTSRHLEQIPEDAAAAYLAVLDTARAAAQRDVDVDGQQVFRDVESAHPVPRTGTKMARIAAAAGSTAAHALRLQADAGGGSSEEPWTAALAQTATVLSSWDWDERMQAALNLRATYKDLPDDVAAAHKATLRPVRLVAAWLTHTNDDGLIPAGARLAEYALASSLPEDTWAAAWFAVNGLALIDKLAPTVTMAPGRATADETARRARLRAAVAGTYAARVVPFRSLSQRAGITDVTTQSWTKHLREPRKG
ncbi:hypothetical protein [Cellulomonas sp. HD19AZ1]|jgi:hypothetical protein|uniref:hypothetical protein n=1 Tax=Cellulomonas sp. HD19AZ1 TaxID=2559593 RepID=UPI001070DFDA|nr:hypothetical protein [Cellulomonas sp. HD19AZ1]TFH68146.1 hypothetical protein E4A51_18040 [Cellulomonas sp. HD19AZ1]